MANQQGGGGGDGADSPDAGLLGGPPSGLARHLDLAALLLLGATAIWLGLHWDAIPDPFPIHWGKGGADRFVARSAAEVYRPIGIGAVLVLFLAGLRRLFLLAIRLKGGRSARAEGARWLVGSFVTAVAWFAALVLAAGSLSPLSGSPQLVPVAASAGGLAVLAVLVIGIVRLGRLSAEPRDR